MLSTVEKVLFLKSIELFSQIPGEDLAQIALVATQEVYPVGDAIFHEGDAGDALYLVLEGRVRVHRGDAVMAELGPKESFGEMAILDAAPRSADVTPLGETSVLKIAREDFQQILEEKPQIATGIIRVLSRRLRSSAAQAL